MVSVSQIISLLIWVGPWVIPRGLAFIRSIRASNRNNIRPVPPQVQRCLNVLFVLTVINILLTLPYFAPQNIYKTTNSRMAISPRVLLTRVADLAAKQQTDSAEGNIPPPGLSLVNQALKDRYSEATGTDFALLYAAYGPDVLAFCPFCSLAEPTTYQLYSFASTFLPHVLNLLLIGLVTTSVISGLEGARWRSQATFAALAIAFAELTLVLRNDWKLNVTKKTLAQVDFFYWRVRIYRYAAFALLDGLLGWAMYLTSTNRWLPSGPPMTQQLTNATNILAGIRAKLLTMGQIRNTVLRDQELNATAQSYWQREPMVMEELETRREVVDAKRMALSKMDVEKMKRDATRWVDDIWPLLRGGGPNKSVSEKKND